MDVSNYLIANTHKNINHREKIEELISISKKVRIICPFISKARAEWLAKYITDERSIELITELTPRGIASGVQLPSVLEYLLDQGVKVSYIPGNLHAKIYWFDDSQILITSANLTNNGLENNFEIGVLFERARAPQLARDITFQEVYNRIKNLWADLKVKEIILTEENLSGLRQLENDTIEIRQKITSYASDENLGFTPISSDCENLSQVDVELQAGSLFKGFAKEDWSAFDHNLSFNPENLTKVKQLLTDKVHPVLKRFYEQFRFARDLEVKLDHFDMGYSLNRWVKNYFPDYRYLWLARKRIEKNSIKHIGEPSFIIGMGKGEINGHWFEVRMGVEELNEPRLTSFGRLFLENMRSNLPTVIEKLHALGEGWIITHEVHSKDEQVEYSASSITSDCLSEIISEHLVTGRIADFHIRRRYFLSEPSDAALLNSPKILEAVAKDMNSLIYFFELAHGNIPNKIKKAV